MPFTNPLSFLFRRRRNVASLAEVVVDHSLHSSRGVTAEANVAPILGPVPRPSNLVTSPVVPRQMVTPITTTVVAQQIVGELPATEASHVVVTNCVDFMYGVMDELYPSLVEQYGDNTKTVIDHAVEDLKRAFNRDHLGQAPITYDDAARRFVYLGLYATARASAMYAIMNKLPVINDLFDREHLNVVCAGGGPGTELIGIAKYMHAKQKATAITAKICDKYLGWESSWLAGGHRLSQFEAKYIEQDFADPSSWLPSIETLHADLYTVSYCLAEFRNRHADADAYFSRLFEIAPKGSYVLFLDIKHSGEFGWFDSIMQHVNFETLVRNSCSIGLLDRDEDRARMRGFRGQFKLRANVPDVAYRLCVKH